MFSKRIDGLRGVLNDSEAVLIASAPNRFYYTGFESSAGYVIITTQSAYFLTDFRYYEKAKSAVTSCAVRMLESRSTDIGKILNNHNIKRLYIESGSTSVSEFETIKKLFHSVTVIADNRIDDTIRQQRSVKDCNELQYIKEAQVITDNTFSYILNHIRPGRTERDIMLDMEFYMRRSGSDGVSFDFIVVSGKNSSLPHGVPTDKIIEPGDFVTMDFGAVVNGYRSDMTRTVAVGYVTDEQTRVYNTVLQAQLAALDTVRPGVVCRDIDKTTRDIIKRGGYEGCFGHGLGHSVGIEIHEDPCFNTRCTDRLSPGNVMTVEPGIYIENKFGVRIEDMVFVTDDGYENITKSEKKLIVL